MRYTVGDKVIGFTVEWVAAKSLAEFSRHEAHHGLSREQLKEVHTLCRAIARRDQDSSLAKDSP
jgi:hypothetical protein